MKDKETTRPAYVLWQVVVPPVVASLVPIFAVPGVMALDLPTGEWWPEVVLAVLSTGPILGFVLAWMEVGRRAAKVLLPFAPYAVLASAFAIVQWFLAIHGPWHDDGSGGLIQILIVGYVYAIPALPGLALMGLFGVLFRWEPDKT